jgi:hypothetical protein
MEHVLSKEFFVLLLFFTASTSATTIALKAGAMIAECYRSDLGLLEGYPLKWRAARPPKDRRRSKLPGWIYNFEVAE